MTLPNAGILDQIECVFHSIVMHGGYVPDCHEVPGAHHGWFGAAIKVTTDMRTT
jgi:hypothetical protein